MDQKQPELVPAKPPKKPKAPLITGLILLLALIGAGSWQTWQRFNKKEQTPEAFIVNSSGYSSDHPNLVVEKVWSHEEKLQTRTFKISYRVKNEGRINTGRNFKVKITVDNNDYFQTISALGYNEVKVTTFNQLLSLLPDKETKVNITVDSNEEIAESDENNNTIEFTFPAWPATPDNCGPDDENNTACLTDDHCTDSTYCSNKCRCEDKIECEDSDHGKEYEKYGEITLTFQNSQEIIRKDFCPYGKNSLGEYFCTLNGDVVPSCISSQGKICHWDRENITCGSGSLGAGYTCDSDKGKCVPLTPTDSSDPDNQGINLSTAANCDCRLDTDVNCDGITDLNDYLEVLRNIK